MAIGDRNIRGGKMYGDWDPRESEKILPKNACFRFWKVKNPEKV